MKLLATKADKLTYFIFELCSQFKTTILQTRFQSVSVPEISSSSMLVRGLLLRSPAPEGADRQRFLHRARAHTRERLSVFFSRRMLRHCFAEESRAFFGTISGLEAFSRKPADGSFAPIVRGRGFSRSERLYRFGSPFRQRSDAMA